jgi:hypothetical protein
LAEFGVTWLRNVDDVARTVRYISLLGLVLATVCAAAGFVAAGKYGVGAYQASGVAATINWVGGAAALALIAWSSDKPWRLHGVLAAMGLRLAPLLIALAYFSQTTSQLASHGVAGLIVVHYLVGLVVETLMSLRLAKAGGAISPRAGDPALTPPRAS